MFDWVADWFNDFKNWVSGIWDDFVEFLHDLPVDIFESLLDGIASVLESIPVPDFIQGGLGQLLAGIDPSILYFINRSGFAEALSLLGAGFAFRMVRKLVTLGQW